MRDNNIGSTNLLTLQNGFLGEIFKGKTLISNLQVTDVPINDINNNLVRNILTMFVAAPVKDKKGKVIAVLTFRLNPAFEFARISNTANLIPEALGKSNLIFVTGLKGLG